MDAWFGPDEVPAKKKVHAEEEAYLKLYEADTTGFDFSAAHEIEAASWVNTSRLTGEEIPDIPVSAAEAMPYIPEEELAVEGEMGMEEPSENLSAGSDPVVNLPESQLPEPELSAETEEAADTAANITKNDNTDPADPFAEVTALPAGERHSLEKEAVEALLAGQYTAFCRDHGLFPGRMAEQINEIFLELVGDILIEADGNRYQLIEDYREDAETWSRA